MEYLSINQIIQAVQKGRIFEATAEDGSFRIKINKYVPYCCMAIHDGSNLRKDLKDKIALDEYQRWYEEDPYTGNFIESLPITIIGLDSRFEYDLNRNPDSCIYEEAWGQKVWSKKLSPKQKQISLKKHHNFYRVVDALITELNKKFESSIVYDIHSYNYKRWEREVPLFNIGSERINQEKYNEYITDWLQKLQGIEIPMISNHSAINDVFFGRGYNLEFITEKHPKTLVLATEIKKVYCDEETGEDFPEIITELAKSFKEVIVAHAQSFIEKETNWRSNESAHLLDKKVDADLKTLDKRLFRLVKNFELLAYVNPINTKREFRRFQKNKYNVEPQFQYAPIKISPFQLKQDLSRLNTLKISDISIRSMYEDVINSYFDKIDLLASLGTEKFLYNSLRYFGRPTKKDIINANYLLHLPNPVSEPKRTPNLSAKMVIDLFKKELDHYQIKSKVELSKKIIAQVMVLNSKNTVLINSDAHFTKREIQALIEHEIGVHMVTTHNAKNQPLNIFQLGLPVNTKTQEGLAILGEYLSGNISLKRLKKLALRVMVIDMMCDGASFTECFDWLSSDQRVAEQEAFTICTRVFRGGGFTKDYLYLNGFVEVLKHWRSPNDIKPLLVGKTAIQYFDTIQEMINRESIIAPKYLTKSFVKPQLNTIDPIYKYIISGLR